MSLQEANIRPIYAKRNAIKKNKILLSHHAVVIRCSNPLISSNKKNKKIESLLNLVMLPLSNKSNVKMWRIALLLRKLSLLYAYANCVVTLYASHHLVAYLLRPTHNVFQRVGM